MTIDDETALERLQHARLACNMGIAAAEAGMQEELLAPFNAAYRNRQLWWQACRDAVDRAIAALPRNAVYAGGRREDIRKLQAGYRAKQVTPAEYSARLTRLMRAG